MRAAQSIGVVNLTTFTTVFFEREPNPTNSVFASLIMEVGILWCSENFEKFDQKLILDQTRAERIRSAHCRFLKYCENTSQLKNCLIEPPFFQGSFSYGTATRPLVNSEFDVDIVFPFALSAFGTPQPSCAELLNWFVSQLSFDDDYASRIIRMPRCVRLDYAGDFHFDIVMSTDQIGSHQPYAVPTRDLTGWITNDPKGLINWVSNLDYRSSASDGVKRFTRSTRMMKRWRDAVCPKSVSPSSILLLTMLGRHEPSVRGYNPPLEGPLFPQYLTDAAYLFDMARLTLSCIRESRTAIFMHPTIPGDNLAASWSHVQITGFEEALEQFIKNLKAGIESDNFVDALNHYRRAFGESFPG